MSLTSPVLTSSHTSPLSWPPSLTTQPTLQRPFAVQVSRAAYNGSGSAKQRGLPTQIRASALAIAAAIMSSVSSGSVTTSPIKPRTYIYAVMPSLVYTQSVRDRWWYQRTLVVGIKTIENAQRVFARREGVPAHGWGRVGKRDTD